MINRKLRGLFVAMLLCAGTAAALFIWGPDNAAVLLNRTGTPQETTDLTDASTRDETGRGTISYMLDSSRWTTFTLPGRLSSLRFLTHPDVPASHAPVAGETFRYGFELEVLDEDGQVLRREQPFFRTELVTYRDDIDGAEVTARRYSDDRSLPLAVDRLILELEDLPRARQVRVRTLSMDGGLTAVNIRVYRPRPYNESNVSALWERLPLSEKRALSVGYVYPPDLLTLTEKESILSHRWQPFGPIGIEGRDYVSRTLEIYDPPGRRVVEAETTLDDGIYLDPQRQAGVALPEKFVALEFTASRPDSLLGPEGLREAPIDLSATIERPFSRTVDQVSIRTDESGEALLSGMPGGRLILSSEEAVWVRVAARFEDGTTRVLSNEIPQTPYQFVDETRSLSIATLPNLGFAIPLRLDMRAAGGTSREVTLRMRGADGGLIAEDRLTLDEAPSLYDRAVDAPEAPLSDTRPVFLLLGDDVAELEIASDGPILAAAYMRPVGIPRRIDVPEDYFARAAEGGNNQSWFRVRAGGSKNSVRDVLIERPLRASASEALVDPDTLDWEDFTPQGDWTARRALVPRGPDGLSDTARRIFFQPVEVGTELPLASVIGPFQPELIVPPDTKTARYAALIDGTRFWEAELPGNRRVSLPPLPADAKILEIQGPAGAEPLISGVALDRLGYIERRLLRLRPGTESFDIQKLGPGREILSIRIFPATETAARADLTIQIDTQRPRNTVLNAWSDNSRSFSIRLSGQEPRAILEQTGRPLGPEQRMFMVLDEDTPEGTYRMTMTLDQGAELLVLISRAAPAMEGQLEFVYEEPEAAK